MLKILNPKISTGRVNVFYCLVLMVRKYTELEFHVYVRYTNNPNYFQLFSQMWMVGWQLWLIKIALSFGIGKFKLFATHHLCDLGNSFQPLWALMPSMKTAILMLYYSLPHKICMSIPWNLQRKACIKCKTQLKWLYIILIKLLIYLALFLCICFHSLWNIRRILKFVSVFILVCHISFSILQKIKKNTQMTKNNYIFDLCGTFIL